MPEPTAAGRFVPFLCRELPSAALGPGGVRSSKKASLDEVSSGGSE